MEDESAQLWHRIERGISYVDLEGLAESLEMLDSLPDFVGQLLLGRRLASGNSLSEDGR